MYRSLKKEKNSYLQQWFKEQESMALDKTATSYYYDGVIDNKPFTNHNIKLKKGDMIYIYSDSYQDQFGGPKGKKTWSKGIELS